jgi:hypothetical protein
MTTVIEQVVEKFIQEHPEELVEGKLRICIGGGAGFIGSHIAKSLKKNKVSLIFSDRKEFIYFILL